MTAGLSPAGSLWLRIAAGTTIAFALLFAVAPARPASRLPWPAQPLLGACTGAALALLVVRRWPHRPARTRSLPVLVARQGFFGLWAANEEILWRRVALGELLPAGGFLALAASTLGFALAHRASRRLHLGTGAVFGGLYLGTGALVASIAAHWSYNALVGGPLERRPEPDGALP
jgi:membrane protease YdiL (CAAX protease family)